MYTLKSIWNYVTYLGLNDKSKSLSNRNIIIANRINFLMIILLFFLNIITAIVREINHTEFTIHTKKLLILLAFCLFNLVFSYFKKHNITRISLIFVPSLIILYLPVFLGFVQKDDFIYYPLIIISFSIVPQLMIKPEISERLYTISLIYFSIQVIFLDNMLLYFSSIDFNFVQNFGDFRIYFKIILITVFIFIQSTIYYLRNLNYEYENELQENNQELQLTINELKLTQQSLIQSEKMASLGVLSAGIAHEINNPLNFIHGGILGIENYFKENLNTHINNVTPFLDAVNEGVKRATEIVSSLNHFTRLDDFPLASCEIHFIIDNCLVMLHSQLKDKVEIKKVYTNLPYKLIGNEGKLHHAIFNIIENALQSIEIKGIITIITNVDKNSLLISFIDTGTGIKRENLRKILDPFFTTKDPGKGTGLGLSITHKIIQEHNGTLEYESELDKGTKVIIKLPINTDKI